MIGNNYKPALEIASRESPILKRLLYIICFDQVGMTLTTPLITLIFFDTQSRLLPENASFATRCMWYGMLNALPNAINIFFSPLLSALSDVFGRRKILLLEIITGCIFGLLLGYGVYYGNLTLIFLAFVIRGAFARTNPTALAIIGDYASIERKMLWMGYLQFAISIGAMVGPMLGGYLAGRFFFSTLNYSFAFFVVAILSLFNFLLAIKYITETLRARVPIASIHLHAFKQTILHKEVLRISFLLLLIQLSWSTFYQFIPPLLKTNFHFNNDQLGIYIGMIAFWLAIASSAGVKWLQNCGTQILNIAIYLIVFGFVATLLGLSNLSYLSPSLLLWFSAIPVAMGDVIAYTYLTTCYSNAVPKHAQGSVMGFSFIVTRVAWTASSILGGYLITLSPLLLFGLAFACIVITLILVHHPYFTLTQTPHSVTMEA